MTIYIGCNNIRSFHMFVTRRQRIIDNVNNMYIEFG